MSLGLSIFTYKGRLAYVLTLCKYDFRKDKKSYTEYGVFIITRPDCVNAFQTLIFKLLDLQIPFMKKSSNI